MEFITQIVQNIPREDTSAYEIATFLRSQKKEINFALEQLDKRISELKKISSELEKKYGTK